MQTLFINPNDCFPNNGDMTPFSVNLTITCPSCNDEYKRRAICKGCGGKGEVLTETGQQLINFITPFVDMKIEDAIYEYREVRKSKEKI